MKKIISVIAIVVGGLVLLSVAVPMIIGTILEGQIADTVGIIGGADGPTAVMVVGSLGAGSVIAKVVIGLSLIAAGICGYRKNREV